MQTKQSQLEDAMKIEDWKKALSLVKNWIHLGEEAETIKLGHDALNNPKFYRQIGKNPEQMVLCAIEALKRRYPWAVKLP